MEVETINVNGKRMYMIRGGFYSNDITKSEFFRKKCVEKFNGLATVKPKFIENPVDLSYLAPKKEKPVELTKPAEPIIEPKPAEVPKVEKQKTDRKAELKAKTMKELKDLAKELGVKGYYKMKENELIKSIMGAEK